MDIVSNSTPEYDNSIGKYILAQTNGSPAIDCEPSDSQFSTRESYVGTTIKQFPKPSVEVIDISFLPNRNFAVLLRDIQKDYEFVTLYRMEDIFSETIDKKSVEPTQTFTHPLQRNSKKIEWSNNDPDILAVGCAGGTLVWHIRTRLPLPSCKDAPLGVATFHSFSKNHSVDVLAFSKKLNGYFACAAASTGIVKVFALTEIPSDSCISTINGVGQLVKQLVWSNHDSFLAVRCANSSRIDFFSTCDWSKQSWVFQSNDIQYIEWFTEHHAEKILVVTENIINILNFVEKRVICEYSVIINEAPFRDCHYFKFHCALQTLVTIHQGYVTAHSLNLEYSEQAEINNNNIRRVCAKNVLENPSRLVVFLDHGHNIKFLLPRLML